MMKHLLFILLSVFTIASGCKSQKSSAQAVTTSNNGRESASEGTPNQLTAAEKKEGWKLLFDGRSKSGWHSYGSNTAGDAWKVADGAIFYDTVRVGGRRPSGDLVTNDEYENFDFKYDWKISKNGNSGVIFLTHEDTSKYKETYYTGLEMQIIDNDGHPDGKILKHRAGDLYDLIKSSVETTKPVGEWNQAEIKLNNGKLDLYLNGANIVSTTIGDDNWNQLVANSKFKSMAGFSKYKKGHICLQNHGNMVWFRNLKIKTL